MAMRKICMDISPAEMKAMFMEEGESYTSVAKRLDICDKTVAYYVKPLLTEEERKKKLSETRCRALVSARQNRWENMQERTEKVPMDLKRFEQPEPEQAVPTLMERLKERDENAGIIRKPKFDGMSIVEETHTYKLAGQFVNYTVDVSNGKLMAANVENSVWLEISKADIMTLVHELQSINAVM